MDAGGRISCFAELSEAKWSRLSLAPPSPSLGTPIIHGDSFLNEWKDDGRMALHSTRLLLFACFARLGLDLIPAD